MVVVNNVSAAPAAQRSVPNNNLPQRKAMRADERERWRLISVHQHACAFHAGFIKALSFNSAEYSW